MNPFWAMAGLALILFAIGSQSFEGRVALRSAQVQACQRGKLDRRANAEGWEAARQARLATATDRSVPGSERASALAAAATYGRIVAGLTVRSRIDCSTAFPRPSLSPFQ